MKHQEASFVHILHERMSKRNSRYKYSAPPRKHNDLGRECVGGYGATDGQPRAWNDDRRNEYTAFGAYVWSLAYEARAGTGGRCQRWEAKGQRKEELKAMQSRSQQGLEVHRRCMMTVFLFSGLGGSPKRDSPRNNQVNLEAQPANTGPGHKISEDIATAPGIRDGIFSFAFRDEVYSKISVDRLFRDDVEDAPAAVGLPIRLIRY
ncbi:hypothetical protein B0H12DRAFT_1067696 [Mycena haematopus]|nr:hypothetical protein B0H12DRAFT_1067696 [Mycena haematopus]